MIGPALMRLVILPITSSRTPARPSKTFWTTLRRAVCHAGHTAGEGLISNPDLVRFFDVRPALRAFSSTRSATRCRKHPATCSSTFAFCATHRPDPVHLHLLPSETEPRRRHERLGQPRHAGRFHRRHDPGLSALCENVQVNLLAAAATPTNGAADLDLATSA